MQNNHRRARHDIIIADRHAMDHTCMTETRMNWRCYAPQSCRSSTRAQLHSITTFTSKHLLSKSFQGEEQGESQWDKGQRHTG
jgi:hypothetical protein